MGFLLRIADPSLVRRVSPTSQAHRVVRACWRRSTNRRTAAKANAAAGAGPRGRDRFGREYRPATPTVSRSNRKWAGTQSDKAYTAEPCSVIAPTPFRQRADRSSTHERKRSDFICVKIPELHLNA